MKQRESKEHKLYLLNWKSKEQSLFERKMMKLFKSRHFRVCVSLVVLLRVVSGQAHPMLFLCTNDVCLDLRLMTFICNCYNGVRSH